MNTAVIVTLLKHQIETLELTQKVLPPSDYIKGQIDGLRTAVELILNIPTINEGGSGDQVS